MSTPVDGIASMNTMLGFGTWRPGHCLECVWASFAANGAQSDQTIPTAYDAWLVSPEADRRGGDYATIPAGVPVYFGPKASSSAGDIVISAGDGWCVATDIPGHQGTIGKIRLADRQAQISRPYLGWTTSILGYPIAYPGNTITALGDIMSLRIIESPSYRAAGYRVIHNGSAAMSVPAGWVQDMIQKGHVDFASYDDDNVLNAEVSMVWQLGGLDNDSAAAKTAAMLADAEASSGQS